MSRKRLLAGVGIATVLALLALSVVLFAAKRPGTPAAVPSILPSPSLSPVGGRFHDEVSGEASSAKQSEVQRNPVLSRLPRDTRFWSLQFEGIEGGKYVLQAYVYVSSSGEAAEREAAEQRRYIEQFIRSTGQPDGTYVLRLQATGRD